MASKDKKSKSSKQDDKKHSKKSDDITIVIDDAKDGESVTSHLKGESHDPISPNQFEAQHGANRLQGDPGTVEISEQISDSPPSDSTKLTAIIIERFEGTLSRGQYEGLGECLFEGGNHYKGEFSCGMMHGEGTFTWLNKQKYEGEFTHNAITGKGAYTWRDGSTYSGEVLNGLRHGLGTYIDKTGQISYTGEWQHGKRDGKGRMRYENEQNSFYDGDWVQNIKHGRGTRQYPSGNTYVGMWFNNVRHGEGTMKWVDSNQMYVGNWEDGVQNGVGQHVWFVRRATGSQYALRNTYNGQFVKGIRHGYGTFYYANGAKYEGLWFNNMKHGQGRFTFKNGRYYEGVFEHDHIKEHPDFKMTGDESPDIGAIRTRTPLPMENMSVHSNESVNTVGPSFQIDLALLLAPTQWLISEDDSRQVTNVVRRHISALKRIYDFYSSLGYYESSDNTFILSHMQFWRLLKDCQLHHYHLNLIDLDRLLVFETGDQQNPHDRILFREFINNLVILSVHLFHDDHRSDESIAYHACVSQIITENVLKHSCKVKGYFYQETRRAVHALEYIDDAYQVYKSVSKPSKRKSSSRSLKMREFLLLLQDLNLISHSLTARVVIQILTSDNPNATDEQDGYNLELEITFLEFFEALVGCAQSYVTEAVAKDPSSTPRVSSSAAHTSAAHAGAAGDQMSLASEPTSGRSALHAADPDDDMDGKSSMAPLMSPRTATPVNPGQTISGPDQTGTSSAPASPTKQRTEFSGSADALRVQENATRAIPPASPNKEPSHAGISAVTVEPEQGEGEETELLTDPARNDAVLNKLESSDDADDGTLQFNFWTHQVFIFFVMKFFPAYHKFSLLGGRVKASLAIEKNKNHNANCICRSRASTTV